MPQNILGETWTKADGRRRFRPASLLCPGPEVTCDLGTVRLPWTGEQEKEMTGNGVDGKKQAKCGLGTGFFLSAGGLTKLLAGNLPEESDVLHADALWRMEARIGIARQADTRTTAQAALFATRHVRLEKGVELVAGLDGLPADWNLPARVAMGGEGRLACILELDQPLALPSPLPTDEPGENTDSFFLVLLTSADLGGAWPVTPGMALSELGENVTLVSACLARGVRLGGWSTFPFGPTARQPLLPAGSVFYCEGQPPAGMVQIGDRKPYGFGLCAVGRWNHQGE